MFLLTLSVCISTTSTSCTTSCSTSWSSWSRVASRGDLQAVGIGAARLITTLTAEQGGNNLFCSAKYLFKKLIGTISRSAASSPPRYFCYFQLKICSCRSHLREVFASFRNTTQPPACRWSSRPRPPARAAAARRRGRVRGCSCRRRGRGRRSCLPPGGWTPASGARSSSGSTPPQGG